MNLTPKQKAFADYYIELGNATEAAIKAGYNEKTARFIEKVVAYTYESGDETKFGVHIEPMLKYLVD